MGYDNPAITRLSNVSHKIATMTIMTGIQVPGVLGADARRPLSAHASWSYPDNAGGARSQPTASSVSITEMTKSCSVTSGVGHARIDGTPQMTKLVHAQPLTQPSAPSS